MTSITIPGEVVATIALLALVWVGMGLLCWPVVMVRYHHMVSHNKGWTWRTTLTGRSPRYPDTLSHVRHWVRVVVGHVVLVLAWPVGLYEARPRPKRTRRTIERTTATSPDQAHDATL